MKKLFFLACFLVFLGGCATTYDMIMAEDDQYPGQSVYWDDMMDARVKGMGSDYGPQHYYNDPPTSVRIIK